MDDLEDWSENCKRMEHNEDGMKRIQRRIERKRSKDTEGCGQGGQEGLRRKQRRDSRGTECDVETHKHRCEDQGGLPCVEPAPHKSQSLLDKDIRGALS